MQEDLVARAGAERRFCQRAALELARRLRGLALAALVLAGCATASVRPPIAPPVPAPSQAAGSELRVTATAFNSVPEQTDGHPALTASGEALRPGMLAIAISRDLERAGLVLGSAVEIEGLRGRWRILDRMAARWERRIDVYMGLDEGAARRFGKRQVTIRWHPTQGAGEHRN